MMRPVIRIGQMLRGLCGEVSHAAVLCPSFYKARIVSNPTAWDRLRERVRGAVIGWLQRRDAARRARWAFGEVS
jgi:indolepyruvate ferredoxin oxidoreductase alpha subunit